MEEHTDNARIIECDDSSCKYWIKNKEYLLYWGFCTKNNRIIIRQGACGSYKYRESNDKEEENQEIATKEATKESRTV